MFPASLHRGLLMTVTLASVGCSDLIPRRSTDGALADTTPEAASSPKPSGRPRGQKEGRPTAATEDAGFAEIRRTLRRLVAAEESFFAENGAYSDELSLIGLRPDKNITIRFLWLSRDGWAASGTHTALAGRDCVVFVGQAKAPPTTLKYVRSGKEGVTVCDDASAPSKPMPTPPAKAKPPLADAGNALDLLDPRVIMKVDLRNLAHSQETYFAMQGTYARRTEPMALQYLWHRDVRVKILAADDQSWAAKATHARFPGKSCVIWFGAVAQRPATDAQHRHENQSGVPVCDD
ncbi:MAG TPA: hypothetical protein VGR09_06950 [Gemmatimonadales bacterium]|nr:hypothetical protein [Gemmatimonadales bacterium]